MTHRLCKSSTIIIILEIYYANNYPVNKTLNTFLKIKCPILLQLLQGC